MIKKKYINFFAIFLLSLLLGLSSSSYALTLTENDIRNFCENAYKAKVNVNIPSSIEQNIANADFSAWVNAISENEGRWAIFYSYSAAYLLVYSGSETNLNTYTMYKDSSNRIYVNTSYLSRVMRSCFTFSDGSFNNSSDIWDVSSFLYTDSLITNNGRRNGTVVYSAGTYKPNSDIFSGRYTNDKFEFSPNTTNFQVCSINGLVQPSEVYVYERTTQNYLTLGYLEKFSNLDNITITRYRYSKSNGWVETSVNAFDDLSGYNVQDDILTYTIDVSRIDADTLVIFNFTPNNIEDFENQVFALYVKSPYTVISNGVIYPSQTFSGDYYNNYNDDSNTDKIVDNNKSDSDKITDTLTDDSQVDNIIGSYLSGDIETYAHDFGFTPLDNPFTTFLLYILEGTYDTLTRSGNVTLSANYKNVFNFELKSQDFVSPESPLKTFIRMMLITWYLYGNYKFFHHLITLVETAKIDRAVAELGTDEFYDTDIM